MSVTVVVVNYRTPALTVEAAESALVESGVTRAIVVDNSPQERHGAHPLRRFAARMSRVTLIESPVNLGFGRAVNLAAQQANARYLLLLNSDAVVTPGSVEKLLVVMENDPLIGVAAPIVLQPDGTPQADAFGSFPSLATVLLRTNRRPRDTTDPDWVSGVAMLVRRQEFADIGGFDSRFFMYIEDVDLCRRYQAHGATIRRVRGASVIHRGGASATRNDTRARQYRSSLDLYLEQTGRPRLERALIAGAGAAVDGVRRLSMS